MSNFNRVLTIPSIRMEDQGEYVCRINNDFNVNEGSIILSIQGIHYYCFINTLIFKLY